MKLTTLGLIAFSVGMGLSQAATAGDSNGNFQVKAGLTGILWQDSNNGIFVNGTQVVGADAHAKDVVLPTATLTYFFTKNISAELFCCFAHANVYTTGTLAGAPYNQGKVADTWAFPPILTLQYHFDGLGPIRPYVGAGVQWIHYFESKSDLTGPVASFASANFKDSFGFALQAGLDYDLGSGWSLGFDAKKVWEDTRISWTGPAGTISTRHDLDPLLLTANIGYRFNLEDLLGSRGAAAAPLK